MEKETLEIIIKVLAKKVADQEILIESYYLESKSAKCEIKSLRERLAKYEGGAEPEAEAGDDN